ncbi:hypothetical protein L2E82_28877 [Cichorium intybus]|uniref:Uncharacterized protein n=1 Tax=Cichorium intybus TaxID=13427 RepID=A0ACB9CWS7_CICIN|nr:hypothetical protein L2E82_28877 [Cichorium intybus]
MCDTANISQQLASALLLSSSKHQTIGSHSLPIGIQNIHHRHPDDSNALPRFQSVTLRRRQRISLSLPQTSYHQPTRFRQSVSMGLIKTRIPLSLLRIENTINQV